VLRSIMKQAGIIGQADKPADEALYVAQWQDSAGSWHTEVYEDEPDLDPDARRWGETGYLGKPYLNDAVVADYALTRFEAAIHRRTTPRKARRHLRKFDHVDQATKTFKVKK
jgi:hypothetical protein